MDVFNNREIAILVWVFIALVWLTRKESGRESLKNLVAAVFAKQLVFAYVVMLSYVFLIIYGLHEAGLWESGQFKNTFMWSLFVAPRALAEINKVKQDSDYFKNTVKSSFAFTAILEFIVGFYSFNLITEIILLPVITMVIGVQAVASRNEEHKPAEKLAEYLLMALGVIVFFYAVHNIIIGIGVFASMETLTDFYTPIVLSLLYLPFVYMLSIYESYNRRFSALTIHYSDPALQRFIKWRALFAFHFNWKVLERWFSHIARMMPETKDEIVKSIREIKELVAYEKNPKSIGLADGWSPYEAKEYLSEIGLKTRDYIDLGDGEWFCGSNYLDLDEGLLPNNLAYYINGDRYIAISLKITLNMNTPTEHRLTPDIFVEACSILAKKALNIELCDGLEYVLRNGLDARIEISNGTMGDKVISVTKEDYVSLMNAGYSIRFELKQSEHPKE